MPILIRDLQKAALRLKPQRIAKSFTEALAKAQATAFLCHSHKDDELAEGQQVLLAENGWDVYIDWKDSAMPPVPDQETAERIKQQISARDWFLFLATPNSTASRWCPWEIGYADSTRGDNKILLIATYDDSGQYYGNEYLQLYRQVTTAKGGKLAAFPAGAATNGILLENLK